MHERLLTFVAIAGMTAGLHAQNTVGLLTNEANAAQPGFTLIHPHSQGSVWLLDNCGRVVHEWPDTLHEPGNSVYLMDNGDLVRCGQSGPGTNSIIFGGGGGEFVDRRSWNGQLIWRYTYNTPDVRMHHDVEMLPNGNVLIVAWERKTLAEAAAMGRDTTGFNDDAVWPEHVIEVQPLGVDTGLIVWEWHAWDHLVQDVDPNLPHYGAIADHPERIDINYDPSGTADWMHVNAIDYNEDLDQILLCSPYFDEIWVIDHSTTTAEAATGSGGNSGMGGDLLWRWGNPQVYGRGTASDQTLFFPHDARWLGPGLPSNDPDIGKILVFNNRAGGTFSTVDLIVPPVDSNGAYPIQPGMAFAPDSAEWRYFAPTPEDLISLGLSGAEKQPNGNFLICSGRQGWIFELDANENIVWEYEVPLLQGQPVAQGTQINVGNLLFRASKYPEDHPFLSSIQLPPTGYIELQPDTTFCGSITVSLVELDEQQNAQPWPNPATEAVQVRTHAGDVVELRDLTGRLVTRERAGEGVWRLDLTGIASGTYVLRVGTGPGALLQVVR